MFTIIRVCEQHNWKSSALMILIGKSFKHRIQEWHFHFLCLVLNRSSILPTHARMHTHTHTHAHAHTRINSQFRTWESHECVNYLCVHATSASLPTQWLPSQHKRPQCNCVPCITWCIRTLQRGTGNGGTGGRDNTHLIICGTVTLLFSSKAFIIRPLQRMLSMHCRGGGEMLIVSTTWWPTPTDSGALISNLAFKPLNMHKT